MWDLIWVWKLHYENVSWHQRGQRFPIFCLSHYTTWWCLDKQIKLVSYLPRDPVISCNLSETRMLKNLFVLFLVVSFAVASPVPEEGENPRAIEDRGLIEDLLINLIRDMVINQINSILGITTTTTPCGGLIGGGLLCPWKIHWKFLDSKLLKLKFHARCFPLTVINCKSANKVNIFQNHIY